MNFLRISLFLVASAITFQVVSISNDGPGFDEKRRLLHEALASHRDAIATDIAWERTNIAATKYVDQQQAESQSSAKTLAAMAVVAWAAFFAAILIRLGPSVDRSCRPSSSMR